MVCLQPEGFRNRQLRSLLAQLLGYAESKLNFGPMSYGLRRLRLHGLMERIAKITSVAQSRDPVIPAAEPYVAPAPTKLQSALQQLAARERVRGNAA